ncbi:MAG TPA: hypothetical protein VFT59_00070, partial [Candidatus Saccharimonadales bacterium]|nr:hypothetical protein [Candidatus Saccharimonadales bacterium]
MTEFESTTLPLEDTQTPTWYEQKWMHRMTSVVAAGSLAVAACGAAFESYNGRSGEVSIIEAREEVALETDEVIVALGDEGATESRPAFDDGRLVVINWNMHREITGSGSALEQQRLAELEEMNDERYPDAFLLQEVSLAGKYV